MDQHDRGGEPVVRPMVDTDIPRARRIERASFPSHWAWGAFAAELRNPTSYLFVAEHPKRKTTSDELSPRSTEAGFVGYAGVWVMNNELHITVIAVDPRWRRRGIARRLIIHAIEYGREQGAACATLEVRRGNYAAQRLYLDMGFVISGIRPRYYLDNNEDAVMMWIHDLWAPETYHKLRRARQSLKNLDIAGFEPLSPSGEPVDRPRN